MLNLNDEEGSTGSRVPPERTMTRRDIIAVAGLTALAGVIAMAMVWPWGARARPDDMPVIGFLNVHAATVPVSYVAAFRHGLEETGYVEGRQFRIEYRWADEDGEMADLMASQLAARRVAVVAASGGWQPVHTLPGADAAIPALFVSSGQPFKPGAAGRPGRNLAGVRLDVARMTAKRLEILKELMPPGARAAMLVGPASTTGHRRSRMAQSERKLAEGQGAVIVRIRSALDFDRELDDALADAVKNGVRGFVVGTDPFFIGRRGPIVALAAKHGLVALYPLRAYVEAGGLASYGPDLADMYRQIGLYTGQILRGVRPGDVPVVVPRKWDLVINRHTAMSLHLMIAPALVARANEIID
jgi:putative ABC transport system substrate-binding protein